MSWGEVKTDVLVALEPAIGLRLVGVEVVDWLSMLEQLGLIPASAPAG